MDVFKNILLNSIWIIIFSFVSALILWCNSRRKNKRFKNVLDSHTNTIKKLYIKLTFKKGFENVFFLVIKILYLISDAIQTVIRFFSYINSVGDYKTCKRINYDSVIGYIVFGYLILLCIFWFCCDGNICFVGIVIWRLYSITIRKLWEFVSIGKDRAFSSYHRTAIFTLLNILELLFGFSYLYRYNQVIIDKSLKAFLFPFHIFITMGWSDYIGELCVHQTWLIGFNILSFFIIISAFFSNMANVKYTNKK